LAKGAIGESSFMTISVSLLFFYFSFLADSKKSWERILLLCLHIFSLILFLNFGLFFEQQRRLRGRITQPTVHQRYSPALSDDGFQPAP
jgi:hypothetical protein